MWVSLEILQKVKQSRLDNYCFARPMWVAAVSYAEQHEGIAWLHPDIIDYFGINYKKRGRK